MKAITRAVPLFITSSTVLAPASMTHVREGEFRGVQPFVGCVDAVPRFALDHPDLAALCRRPRTERGYTFRTQDLRPAVGAVVERIECRRPHEPGATRGEPESVDLARARNAKRSGRDVEVLARLRH